MSNSINLLKTLSHSRNVILLEYHIDMHRTDFHSYLNPSNYYIVYNDRIITLPYTTKIEEIISGYMIRITLPNSFANYLNSSTLLLGNLFLREVYYIKSKEGYVQDFCLNHSLGSPIELLSITNGSIEIIDSSTILYKYTGKNSFLYVDFRDFYIKAPTKIIRPIDIDLIDTSSFKLIFPSDSFSSIDSLNNLYVTYTPVTHDFFGFTIIPNESISLKKSITIPPLDSSQDNPFKGGSYVANYTILVDNSHVNRIYGIDLNTTYIYGNMFVEMNSPSPLETEDAVTFIGLGIDGDLNINLNNKLNGVICKLDNLNITGNLTITIYSDSSVNDTSSILSLTNLNILGTLTLNILGNGSLYLHFVKANHIKLNTSNI